MNNLYVMVGISGSGKSTEAIKLAKENNAKIISTDEIRGRFGDENDQSRNNEVFNIWHKEIKENLLNGVDVIADATNITIKSRRQIFNNLTKVNCNVIAIIVSRGLDECIELDSKRERVVKAHNIRRQALKFQIPFYEEGFDEIRIIHNEKLKDNFYWNTLDSMNGFDQKNPHHNVDLYMHCETVSNQLEKKYHDLYFPEDIINYRKYRNKQLNLIFAGLLHDNGKVFSQTFDENGSGVAHYYGHENIGTYYLLSNSLSINISLKFEKDDWLEILFYINYHMLPMNWKTTKTLTKWENIFGKEKFDNLLLFHECDKYRE